MPNWHSTKCQLALYKMLVYTVSVNCQLVGTFFICDLIWSLTVTSFGLIVWFFICCALVSFVRRDHLHPNVFNPNAKSIIPNKFPQVCVDCASQKHHCTTNPPSSFDVVVVVVVYHAIITTCIFYTINALVYWLSDCRLVLFFVAITRRGRRSGCNHDVGGNNGTLTTPNGW